MTRTIAHYERIEQIGEGTYGQVYKAKCLDTGRIVALKKVHVHHGGYYGMPPTVIREIKILKRLFHPNLVEMLEVVSSKGVEYLEEHDVAPERKSSKSSSEKIDDKREGYKGNIYLVLEYVSHDLTGLMDVAYRFTEQQVKCIFRQLLEALQYMHEHKYIHRDIKSSNILIDSQFRVKLADFGLARNIEPPMLDNIHDRGAIHEFTNKVITLWYRPPEILLGATRYGPAVDMWSAGCILAELLLGRPLFTGKTEMEQLEQIFDLLGTPTLDSWEGFQDLKLMRTGEVTIEKQRRPKLRDKYGHKMPAVAMNLIEKLLELDPNKRLTASRALTSRYFLTEPRAPDRPEDLGKLELGRGGGHFHEFQTKKKRREAKALAKKASNEARAAGMSSKEAEAEFEAVYRDCMKKVAEEGNKALITEVERREMERKDKEKMDKDFSRREMERRDKEKLEKDLGLNDVMDKAAKTNGRDRTSLLDRRESKKDLSERRDDKKERSDRKRHRDEDERESRRRDDRKQRREPDRDVQCSKSDARQDSISRSHEKEQTARVDSGVVSNGDGREAGARFSQDPAEETRKSRKRETSKDSSHRDHRSSRKHGGSRDRGRSSSRDRDDRRHRKSSKRHRHSPERRHRGSRHQKSSRDESGDRNSPAKKSDRRDRDVVDYYGPPPSDVPKRSSRGDRHSPGGKGEDDSYYGPPADSRRDQRDRDNRGMPPPKDMPPQDTRGPFGRASFRDEKRNSPSGRDIRNDMNRGPPQDMRGPFGRPSFRDERRHSPGRDPRNDMDRGPPLSTRRGPPMGDGRWQGLPPPPQQGQRRPPPPGYPHGPPPGARASPGSGFRAGDRREMDRNRPRR